MTVVIPVWGARYVASLERAIASVRAQDADVPIIVADNASDVEVPEVSGTTLVRSPRRLSVGEARNFGLQHVDTELVIVLDADDELIDGALASLRAGIAADPGVAVYSMSLLEADTGLRHRTPRRFVPALARAPRLFALATAIWSLYPIQGSAILRTRWVREAGAYPDCDWGDDWVVAVSQAFRGRIVVDPRPGGIYHPHPESLWRRGRPASDLLAAAKQVRGAAGDRPGRAALDARHASGDRDPAGIADPRHSPPLPRVARPPGRYLGGHAPQQLIRELVGLTTLATENQRRLECALYRSHRGLRPRAGLYGMSEEHERAAVPTKAASGATRPPLGRTSAPPNRAAAAPPPPLHRARGHGYRPAMFQLPSAARARFGYGCTRPLSSRTANSSERYVAPARTIAAVSVVFPEKL